jgi:hypothetical protein
MGKQNLIKLSFFCSQLISESNFGGVEKDLVDINKPVLNISGNSICNTADTIIESLVKYLQ